MLAAGRANRSNQWIDHQRWSFPSGGIRDDARMANAYHIEA
jgi:hypothetical protein